jgi:phytoene dehydrogenase-like protein
MSDEIVVVGAGVNGLACALELARAGKRVLVLERRDVIGGLSARRAFGDGFSVPGIRHDTSEIRPALVEALGLSIAGRDTASAGPSSQGLSLLSGHVPVYASEPGGPGLLVHASPDAARGEIARRSRKDADAYAALRGLLARVRTVIEPLLDRAPPPLLPHGVHDAIEMGFLGLKLRGLGREDMVELLRALPMCVADLLRERFETELLSATLALPAVLGDFTGPWSPGTAAMFILREAVLVPGVKGGPAAVVDALAAALKWHGAKVRTGARVARISVQAGRARGVVLESGERVAADAVVAAVSPRHALTELLPPLTLGVRDTEASRTIRTRGTAAKVHLGLRGYPAWAGRPGERFERVRIGPCLDDLERAFDAAKYRRLPAAPALDLSFPTAAAPAGDPHVASILVSGVPFNLEGGWGAEAKAALLESVLTLLEAHAPGVRALVAASEVLSPADIEAEFGATGGSIHHVERALDQMVLMRPARPFARHATPVEGLYLGSSGCHPGPGVTLAPGVLAARAVLGEARERR